MKLYFLWNNISSKKLDSISEEEGQIKDMQQNKIENCKSGTMN